ncbi:MAG TPA: hypothetical protein VI861_04555 [Rickettsiales bacterium]|nr:hypothetical protein [Rickettsiales bacterium]
MKNLQHKELAASKWFRMDLMAQLGNVGSEVSRALSWRKKNNFEQSNKAFFRALELIYLTIEDKKNIKRLREITRMREVLIDFFLGKNEYNSDEKFLDKYFLQFGIAARKNK